MLLNPSALFCSLILSGWLKGHGPWHDVIKNYSYMPTISSLKKKKNLNYSSFVKVFWEDNATLLHYFHLVNLALFSWSSFQEKKLVLHCKLRINSLLRFRTSATL